MKRSFAVIIIISTLLSVVFSANTSAEYEKVTLDGITYEAYDDYCALYECDKEKSGDVVIPSSVKFAETELPVKAISMTAFSECVNIQSITVPDGVTEIWEFAFFRCEALKSITLPEGITHIRAGTFEYCGALTHVELPQSLTVVENYAFSGCSSLTEIKIPGNVTDIGGYAFENCINLTSIVIPDSVTYLGDHAFYGCTGLTAVSVPDGLTSVSDDLFVYCDSLVYNEYGNGCYIGNDENKYVMLVKAKDRDITSCEINSQTSIICSRAFESCGELTEIVIPEGVTVIGDYLVYGCEKLKSVSLPSSVCKIDSYAFSWCSALESISIAKENKTYHSKDNCLINTEEKDLIAACKSSVIPDDGSVTSVNGAFYGNKSIESVIIPASVTFIGVSSFEECENLKTVHFKGSKAQWDNIDIEIYNDPLTGAEIIFGVDAVPGDCNGDGYVNNKDVVFLFRYVSSDEREENESVYDINADGDVNNKDVVALFREVSAS